MHGAGRRVSAAGVHALLGGHVALLVVAGSMLECSSAGTHNAFLLFCCSVSLVVITFAIIAAACIRLATSCQQHQRPWSAKTQACVRACVGRAGALAAGPAAYA